MTITAASLALKAIADSRTPLTKHELIANCALPAGVLDALIIAYGPLGLIHEDEERGTVHSPHMKSRLMLRSLAYSIEERLLLIDDWERDGSEGPEASRILDRGAFVLNAFETRRIELGSSRPTHSVAVSKAIIKKMDPIGGPSVLMMLNQSSGRFQLIGGKARAGESAQRAVEREISEELPGNTLQHGRDYTLMQVAEIESTMFVSPTQGAYTAYTVTYFYTHMESAPRTTPQHRWVTLREVSTGQTDDGHLILPSAAQFPGLLNMLTRAPLSLQVAQPAPSQPTVTGNPQPDQTSQRSMVRLALVTMMLLVTVAAVAAAIVYLSSTAAIGIAQIAAVLIPILLAVLAFVALGSGWIRGDQFVHLFSGILGRRSGAAARSGKSSKRRLP